MATDMSGGPGAFRRLMNKVATWSQALDYSGFDKIESFVPGVASSESYGSDVKESKASRLTLA